MSALRPGNTATHNFLNYALVKRLKLPQSKSDHEYVVHLANGQDSNVWDTVVKGANLKIQDYEASLDFQVMHLAQADIYLGREWLYNLGPSLSCSYQDNSLEFTHEGRRVRLQGESHVPTAPLISSVELRQAAAADEIEQVYVVTPIHSFLSVDESDKNSSCLNNVSVDETVNEKVFESKQKQRLGTNPCFDKPVLTACENKKTKAETEKNS